MRLALIALLTLGASSPQEVRLEEVLDLMEKRAEGLRDLSFKVQNRADRNMGMPRSEVAVTYVRGVGLRVRARSETTREARGFGLNSPSAADFIYTPERFRLLQEWDERAGGGLIGLQAAAIRTDDPALKSHDHLLLPSTGYPMRLLFDEPLAYYQIAPRMFFGLEPNLVCEGKRTEGSKTHVVLASTPAPRDPKLPQPGYSVHTRRKQFFIDPATGAVARIRWEITFRFSAGGAGNNEQRMTWVIEPTGARKVTETLSLPESVRWSQVMEGRNPGRAGDLVRTLAAVRANAGLGAGEILTDAERDDLYADAVARPAEEYEARVRKDPSDAEAHYALAQARGMVDPFARMLAAGGGAAKPADPAPVLSALEKAAELRPKAEGPLLNLLSAHRAAGDEAREKEFLARIEKAEAPGGRVRLRAAARLNALGEADRAAKLLEGLVPATEEERRRAALERFFVAAARGHEGKLLKIFAEEAGRCAGSGDKIAFVRTIEGRAEGLPEAVRAKWTAEKMGELVEKGLKENPAELAWRVAKAALLRGQGKAVASAVELLEAAPADAEIVDRALDEMDPVQGLGQGPEKAAEPLSPDDKSLPRLVTALEKAARGDPRLELQTGRALAASSRPEEARKKFDAALEACRAQGPGRPYHGEAMRAAFQLGVEPGPEGWREKCVEVILAIGKESGAVPYDLIYDETRNPIGQALGDLLGRKEWLKFYRLSVAALRMAGGNYFLWRHRDKLNEEGLEAIKKEVAREESVEKYLDLADFLEGFRDGADVAGALEKAREKAPKDLEILERLARKHASLGSAEKASAAFGELLPQLPADRRPSLQMELAQVHVGRKDAAKAKEVLGKVDLKAVDGAGAVRLAELWGQAEEWDRAIEACRRAYELGLKPHFQMGRFHEKKQDPYEALRHYNRDRAEGSTAGDSLEGSVRVKMARSARPPRPGGEEDAEPATGEEARARLLKKLGPDWLQKRFLEQKQEPLGPPDEKRVKASLEKLASDGVDDRDAGFEELRKFGPRAAPLVAPLLKSGDDEVKARVRQLILEWAEPK